MRGILSSSSDESDGENEVNWLPDSPLSSPVITSLPEIEKSPSVILLPDPEIQTASKN